MTISYKVFKRDTNPKIRCKFLKNEYVDKTEYVWKISKIDFI